MLSFKRKNKIKLESNKQTVVTSGIGNTYDFQVKVTSKTFDVLIDKLYSDKPRAILREIGTNAYEAHVMANKKDVPFLVVLPNYYCQELIIRDYGPGLTTDQVKNIYTVLFESTKENTNDVGGCFGLGSKSPFCYVDSFTITSYVDGVSHCYTVFRNDERIPTVLYLGPSQTSEENGLEIKIPVSYNDIADFRRAAKDVYQWFETKPKIIGQQIDLNRSKPQISGNGWEYHSHNYYSSFVVMANVAYEIPTNLMTELHIPSGLVLFCNIGDVEPEPSRESLSLNKKTKDSISTAFSKMKSEYTKDYMDKLKKYDDFWSFSEQIRTTPDNPFINKSDFKWTDPVTQKVYNYGCALTHDKNVLKLKRIRTLKDLYEVDSVYPGRYSKVLFVEDDEPKGRAGRIRTLYNNVYSYGTAIIFTKDKVKELKESLLVPDSMIKKFSDIPEEKAGSRSSGYGKTSVVKLKTNKPYKSQYNSHFWENCEIDLKNESGWYLPTYNNAVVHNSKNYSMDVIFSLKKMLGQESTIVYGFRPGLKFDSTKWKNYLDELVTLINDKLSKCDYVSFSSIENEWNFSYSSTFNKKSIYNLYTSLINNMKLINDQEFHTLLKEIDEVNSLKETYNKGYELLRLISVFGIKQTPKKIDISNIRQSLETFSKKYPLLNSHDFKKEDIAELKIYMKGK